MAQKSFEEEGKLLHLLFFRLLEIQYAITHSHITQYFCLFYHYFLSEMLRAGRTEFTSCMSGQKKIKMWIAVEGGTEVIWRSEGKLLSAFKTVSVELFFKCTKQLRAIFLDLLHSCSKTAVVACQVPWVDLSVRNTINSLFLFFSSRHTFCEGTVSSFFTRQL